ncbi:Flp family type IVb pilin [Alloalcanivorax xenomutans]|uniref:Flp family type IVb pilin n=1 Tax=Alloalcanivorax xenomutans TaxID=1094342 RepID=UPI00292F9AEC|nr:hypothetical protein [Alloalcanivorax xenomutans]WOA31678.1 hypothetical protein RVY87_01095 [Alloalcanivorax xenomutans]
MKMIQSINTATQSLMARLFSQMPTRSNRQRGASALEYIMLAAVIVGLLVVVATQFGEDGENPILNFFEKLFTEAEDAGGLGD